MTTAATPSVPSSIPGVNVCLMGPSGTGKTYSIATATLPIRQSTCKVVLARAKASL